MRKPEAKPTWTGHMEDAGGYNFDMVLEFRRAVLPEEADELWKLDVAIFGKDAFRQEDWLSLESYWVVVDGSGLRLGRSNMRRGMDSGGW